jgi:hypothetical protein
MAKSIGWSPVIQALQLTALFVGGSIWQQKQPYTPHTSFVSVWLSPNSYFVAWENIFIDPSDYNEIPLCKMLYFVGGTGLLAE